MEDKEKEVKEKAIINEKLRIASVCEKLESVKQRYSQRKEEWAKIEQHFIDSIAKLEQSIESGRNYVENIEKSLTE